MTNPTDRDKPRYHVEGQTSTEGQRWLIWDGVKHYARFKSIADELEAYRICEELNRLSATPTPQAGDELTASGNDVLREALEQIASDQNYIGVPVDSEAANHFAMMVQEWQQIAITALSTTPTMSAEDMREAAAKVARDYASKARNRGWTTAPDSAAKAGEHIATAIRSLPLTKEPSQ